MKLRFFFVIALSSLILNSYGQIKMNSSGDVGIGVDPHTHFKFAVTGETYLNGNVGFGGTWPITCMHMKKDNWFLIDVPTTGSEQSGIMFWEENPYGVATATDVNFGAKVYYDEGSDGLYLVTKNWSATNLGIFIQRSYGKVAIGHDNPSVKLDVEGSIYASGTITSSDSRLKKNITELSNQDEMIDRLKKLNAISYTAILADAEEFLRRIDNEPDTLSSELIEIQRKIYERIQYGYVAEDFKQHFPELVVENNEGYLGIDYVSMIPLLVEAIKEQQLIIDKLQNEIGIIKSKESIKSEPIEILGDETQESAALFQNSPNPFNEVTEIKYYISADIQNAFINIYDLAGTQLRSVGLHLKENGNILINGGEFPAGMYIYALIADGIMIDSKQMILTD